jgi:hypothetical protein
MVWTNGSCASNSGIEANCCGSEVDRLNLQAPQTDMWPIRLAANDLGARGAGPAATVCIPVIAARRPIPVHFENAPRTFMRLFSGGDFGKQLLKIADAAA